VVDLAVLPLCTLECVGSNFDLVTAYSAGKICFVRILRENVEPIEHVKSQTISCSLLTKHVTFRSVIHEPRLNRALSGI
jgi:hypothetical protein